MSKKQRGASAKKKPDRRPFRTRGRLASSLISLLQEKPFDTITVRDVLERAQVGRSTFYAHYRDKNDLFVSDVDEFLERFSNSLSARNEKSDRVAPVKELFAHVREMQRLYRALVDSGRIQDFYDLARGHFAKAIERRLKDNSGTKRQVTGSDAIAHAHAGALLSLLKWWVDTGMKESPAEMDEAFHRLVGPENSR